MRLEIFFKIGYVCKFPRGGGEGSRTFFSSKSIALISEFYLSSWYLMTVSVLCLFLTLPSVIVVFPDHTHSLLWTLFQTDITETLRRILVMKHPCSRQALKLKTRPLVVFARPHPHLHSECPRPRVKGHIQLA